MKGWKEQYGCAPDALELQLQDLPSKGLLQSQPWTRVLTAKSKAI